MAGTALLICDIQTGIVNRLKTHDTEAYLQRVASTIKSAREANIRVIYVRVAFRLGHPEAAAPETVKARGLTSFVEGNPSTQIHRAISPHDHDIVVTKRRVSAFHGTDLDLLLRSLRIETLIICGLSTSGVVMSSVRQGSDMDYKFVVLEDLCLDTDQAMHDACVKVLGKQAQIVQAEDWVAGLHKQG